MEITDLSLGCRQKTCESQKAHCRINWSASHTQTHPNKEKLYKSFTHSVRCPCEDISHTMSTNVTLWRLINTCSLPVSQKLRNALGVAKRHLFFLSLPCVRVLRTTLAILLANTRAASRLEESLKSCSLIFARKLRHGRRNDNKTALHYEICREQRRRCSKLRPARVDHVF